LSDQSLVGKLARIDRRMLYVLLVVALSIPILQPMGLPLTLGKETKDTYDALERVPSGGNVLLLTEIAAYLFPELGPQVIALSQHCFNKKLKVVYVSFRQVEGPTILESLVLTKVDFRGAKYGEDYVNLGYFAGLEISMAAFASNIHALVKEDFRKNPLEKLPLMANLKTAKDFQFIIIIGVADEPIRQFGPYGVTTVVATYAVVAPEVYPYYASGQVKGILVGVRGAAEYEQLVKRPYLATASMDAISMSHVLVLVLILIGNIGYLYETRRKK